MGRLIAVRPMRRARIGGRLTTLHIALTAATALGLALTLGVGLLTLVRDRSPQPWLDRIILLDLAVGALAALSGLALVIVGDRPGDTLHFVYGVAVLAVVPATRYMARAGRWRPRAAWISVGAVVGLLVVARLAMTG
jgi:hypothetical protein